MKLLPVITIIGIALGLSIQGRMPRLYAYKPVETIVEAQNVQERPPLDAEVIGQIVIEFGEYDRHIIKQAIDIAYKESGLKYNAYNFNSNGTSDYSVFQVNTVHIKRFGDKFTYNWKENIRVAHILYEEQGWRPWVAAHKLGYVK